jgi:RecA-family ATPase
MAETARDFDRELPELPPAVADSIASWRRTIGNARPEIAPDILLNAAADLFRTRTIVRTVSPDAYGIVTQAIADALHHMAQAAGIDPDDAQRIFAEAQQRGEGFTDRAEHVNGHAAIDGPTPAAKAAPITAAALITPAHWPLEAPPPVDWLADSRIPRGEVTTLHGDGGAGKTDLATQLAAGCARSAPYWFGHEIVAGHVVFISAEEPDREIRRRIWLHSQRDGYALESLTDLHLWFPGEAGDAVMAVPDYHTGIMRPTPLFLSIEAAVLAAEPVLVVVDNVAATFAGNQNDRVMVRSFVNLWRRIARGPSRPAVLLLDHPSLSGLTSGTGRGGNMDWRNAVRSALYLRTPDDKAEADRGIRILETVKSNYGPPGNPVRLQWVDGGLAPEHAPSSLHRLAKDAECDETFLRLLDERAAQGRHVSDKSGRNYAPSVFADMAGNGGFTAKAFARAMDRLFEARTIALRPERRDGKTRDVIDRTNAANATPSAAA